MRNLINRPIGAGLDNTPDDIRIVRGSLKAFKGDDIVPAELSGFIDDKLDTDIREFQRQVGVIEDGKIAPGGETERNLMARITGEGIDSAAPDDAVLGSSVGDGGENAPADVAAMKRALGTTGHLKYDRTAQPPPFVDTAMVEAITKLQEDTGLLTDGRADPNGETIAALRDLLGEKADAPVPDETQVALGPALIPLLMFLGRTAGPQIIKKIPSIIATNEAANNLTKDIRRRQDVQNEGSQGATLENIPLSPNEFGNGREEFPSEPPGKNDGKLEGRPTEPVANIPETFPLPENPENLIQIFPGGAGTPQRPLIVERRGNETTRAFNARLARLFEKLGQKFSIVHIGGSRDADGNEIPETHLKNKDTGGLKGGSFPDITFEITGLKKLLVYINSADTYADGVTLSSREEKAAKNIEYNMEDHAVLITLPKPKAGQTIDIEALGKMLEPILNDLQDVAEGKIDITSFEKRRALLEKLPLK